MRELIKEKKWLPIVAVIAILLGGGLIWRATRPSEAAAKQGEAKHFLYQDAAQQQAAEMGK